MRIYVVTGRGGKPVAGTSLEEVQEHLQERYATFTDLDPLTFEENNGCWSGYNWSNTDAEGQAAAIPEEIYEVDLPSGTPSESSFPESVRLELRVTTRTKKMSYEENPSEEVWANKDLRSTIIDLFIKKAGRVLAASISEE